ncbi:hypothetical protein C8Q72DRAFT_946066 [Fomitopsis betulina]|nr:hypothetical protein C8Q72DRAFT_946066 [Fomitopsis betulina]
MEIYNTSSICGEGFRVSRKTLLRFTAISRTSLILSDIIVIITTWWSLWGMSHHNPVQGRKSMHSSLVYTLLRDGTLYFILLLLLNLAQISVEQILGNNFNPMPRFTMPTMSIIMSRLILNLRSVSFTEHSVDRDEDILTSPNCDSEPVAQRSLSHSQLSTVVFRASVASLDNARNLQPRTEGTAAENGAMRGPDRDPHALMCSNIDIEEIAELE